MKSIKQHTYRHAAKNDNKNWTNKEKNDTLKQLKLWMLRTVFYISMWKEGSCVYSIWKKQKNKL